MIVHDHGAIVAEMRDQPLALAEILGDAFIGVIADPLIETHRLLGDHPQSALEAGDGHPGPGVDVHRAIDIRPAAQHAAVQREAGTIDPGPLVQILVHVDLDQIGGGHLGP